MSDLEEWKTLRIEVAREALRRRLMSENKQFSFISNPAESRAKSRTAKEKYKAKLDEEKAPEELPLPDEDDMSVKRFT
jgi:hypothetical protein